MSSISCLVAHLTVMLDKSMPVCFSRPLLSQTFCLTLNQLQSTALSIEDKMCVSTVIDNAKALY